MYILLKSLELITVQIKGDIHSPLSLRKKAHFFRMGIDFFILIYLIQHDLKT